MKNEIINRVETMQKLLASIRERFENDSYLSLEGRCSTSLPDAERLEILSRQFRDLLYSEK